MSVNSAAAYFTLPKVAELLGVSPDAMRYWIRRSWIPAPAHVAGVEGKVYTAAQAVEILEIYIQRAAAGLCRGSGASEKQQQALEILKARAQAMKQRLSSNESPKNLDIGEAQ